jgi:hypothetical protein
MLAKASALSSSWRGADGYCAVDRFGREPRRRSVMRRQLAPYCNEQKFIFERCRNRRPGIRRTGAL